MADSPSESNNETGRITEEESDWRNEPGKIRLEEIRLRE
jgi:hypothetical protein